MTDPQRGLPVLPGEDGGATLPDRPWAVEVELELTNNCNAACVACPRGDMPEHGRMSLETLDAILDHYDAVRPDHPLNQRLGELRFPRISLAGGGDPLLHPQAVGFVEHATARGYDVHLITNAAALNERRTGELVRSGVRSIACSFWGIRKEEYEASMRLPYERSLANVERLAARARDAGVPLCVLWVRTPQMTSTSGEVAAFWAERGIDVDMGDNHMWNRGGLNPLPPGADTADLLPPDPSRRVWCADLYLSDTWTWDGRCLLCCCNYFTSAQFTIADLAGAADVGRRKEEILRSRPLPAMCQVCLQPRRSQSRWLGEPWEPFVDGDEWRMLTYES